ncbi:hypothetical protein [Rhizobium sp. L245/93]|uniref:hypothetical protein n=1 Tax=Rhizobium sp. L245/93 TaxID=2819998 RepID=UPI001ADA3BE4|nr:hypothetical protein [Rhizobium sp. L245/93]MBO9170905.1 hypothetical protein [Rhizobium sp. L245/93]
MFSKKPTRRNELELDIAVHKDAIERPPMEMIELPSHSKPVDLASMGFDRITSSDEQFFLRSAKLSDLLELMYRSSNWFAVETDKAIADRWSGHVGRGEIGRHYHLYYNAQQLGALVIGADQGYADETHKVRFSATIKYPFLYRFDDLYSLLRPLAVQVSDDTRDDVRDRELDINQALLRALWDMRHDEAYYFAFQQAGPATKLFSNLK